MSVEDIEHYYKAIVVLDETIKIMKQIDETIDAPRRLAKKKGNGRETRITWPEAFMLLSKFVERRGNALAPISYATRQGFKLGNWVSHQRTIYKRGKLSKERQKLLEELPGWQWDIVNVRWSEGLNHLRDYVESEGHTFVPKRYVTKDGFKLGNWVLRQRMSFKRGELSKERRKALGQIPRWVWDMRKAKWREGFEHLRNYAEHEGHTNVPQSYVTKDCFNLGLWVMGQKAAYRRGMLPSGWRQLLDLFPDWRLNLHDPAGSENWQEGLKYLCEYVELYGVAHPISTYVAKDGYKLGNWVVEQRMACRRGELSLKQQKMLEQLPGWVWNPRDAQWQKGFESLCHYVGLKGHSRVPSGYRTEDGYSLGPWINN